MATKLERLGEELEKARVKYAEWGRRVKDLEERYSEEENSVIHTMVHAANLTPEQLAAIQIPTLVLAGSEDVIDETDTRFIAESIPGADLRILPGEDHDSYIVGSTKVAELILEYCRE